MNGHVCVLKKSFIIILYCLGMLQAFACLSNAFYWGYTRWVQDYSFNINSILHNTLTFLLYSNYSSSVCSVPPLCPFYLPSRQGSD